MIVIKYLTGSTVYGTSLDNPDRDIVQVYIPSPADTILGRISNTHKIANEDVSRYPLAEFTKMLAKGNPNVFPYLFTPDQYIEVELVKWIRTNKNWFVSQKAVKAMLGMAGNQLKDMQTGVTGRMGVRRKELVAEIGYDPKAAYHAMRIATMAAELAEFGTMYIDRTWIDAEYLKFVRRGGLAPQEVANYVDKYAKIAELAMNDLTPEPEYAKIEQYTVDSIIKHWKENGKI